MMPSNPVALIVSLGLTAWLGVPATATRADAQDRPSGTTAQAGALKDRFVGTWKLVDIEQRNAKGEVIPRAAAPASGNPVRTGYIIYDPAGYVAVSIMPVGRPRYAGPQATGDEAKAALTGYTGYFGTFTIDPRENVVTHHLQGSVNPGMAADQKRVFEFAANRLTLQTPPAANGNRTRLTWERVPDLTHPSADQSRFFGFWKLVSNERRDERGALVSSNPGQTGYIIYTRAGFMAVHMMQPNRKPYAGAQATPEEARATIGTYTNYFGPFYVHEADGYIVHDQFGTLNLGRNGPGPLQRFYQMTGRRLLLKPPPTYTPDGHTIQGTITWERADAGGSTP
jgi:hypothetical protein